MPALFGHHTIIIKCHVQFTDRYPVMMAFAAPEMAVNDMKSVGGAPPQADVAVERVRTFFPETWIFDFVILG